MEYGVAQVKEYAEINDRKVWRYLIPTTVGEFSLVQYEEEGKELTDAFIGIYAEEKAKKVFTKTVKKLINGTI